MGYRFLEEIPPGLSKSSWGMERDKAPADIRTSAWGVLSKAQFVEVRFRPVRQKSAMVEILVLISKGKVRVKLLKAATHPITQRSTRPLLSLKVAS